MMTLGMKRLMEVAKVDELELKEVVTEFLKLLNKQEVSDSGTEFRPNYIGSCRVMDQIRMGELLHHMEEITK